MNRREFFSWLIIFVQSSALYLILFSGLEINHYVGSTSNNDESLGGGTLRPHPQPEKQEVSMPVPRDGIEAMLLTSSTVPPFHIFSFPPSTDIISKKLLQTGLYEVELSSFLDKIFPPLFEEEEGVEAVDGNNHYVAVDLGANIGFHSLHIASRGAHVISFEASPDTAWLLKASAALNGFLSVRPTILDNQAFAKKKGTVTLIAKGASDTNSTGRLSRHAKSAGMTSFASDTPFDLKQSKDGAPGALDADIPLVRVSDVLEDIGILPVHDNYKLRLLKVDVEGFELRALKGLDLNKYRFEYLTFEFFPSLLKSSGVTNPADLLVFVWSHGYRYFEMVNNQQKWERFIDTGDTEHQVRLWAQGIVDKGQRDGYHVNFFAKLT